MPPDSVWYAWTGERPHIKHGRTRTHARYCFDLSGLGVVTTRLTTYN